jgi:hypothetical protein
MNPWTQFLGLIPKPTKLAGVVVSCDSNNRHLVSLPTGGYVFGNSSTTYPNGTRVFVVDGVVTGKAPALTQIVQTVGP